MHWYPYKIQKLLKITLVARNLTNLHANPDEAVAYGAAACASTSLVKIGEKYKISS